MFIVSIINLRCKKRKVDGWEYKEVQRTWVKKEKITKIRKMNKITNKYFT